jgi:hypothetical protein
MERRGRERHRWANREVDMGGEHMSQSVGSEVSNDRPGRRDPHPSWRVAHDHGYRAAALSLLLRAALCARGYVFE